MRRRLLLSSLVLLFFYGEARGQPRISLKGEVGPELDTNATRIQPPLVLRCPAGWTCENGICEHDGCQGANCTPLILCTADADDEFEEAITAGLLKLSADANLTYRVSSRHHLALSYGAGGKIFVNEEARSANEFLQRGSATWSIGMGRSAALSLSGSYYDSYQQQSFTDFRTGSGSVQLTMGQRASGLQVSLSGGYRALQYKPLAYFDFHGPVGGLELSSVLPSGGEEDPVDWALSLSYQAAWRHFKGDRLGTPEDCHDDTQGLFDPVCSYPQDEARQDHNHLVRAEAQYLGNAEAALWYSCELNRSNSYGETYLHQGVGLRFTTLLLWELILTVQGVLQFSRFGDVAPLNPDTGQRFFKLEEDENRSQIVLQLATDLSDQLGLILRYTLYADESVRHPDLPETAELPAYFRQTLFVGLNVDLDLL